MVTRLWGTINGWPVTFSRLEGDTWTCLVPRSDTGTWVIALWAADEAGNIGYYATVRFSFTAKDVSWKIEILDLGAGVSPEDVAATFGISGPVDVVAHDGVHGAFGVTGPVDAVGADMLRATVRVDGPMDRADAEDIRSATGVKGPADHVEPDAVHGHAAVTQIREESQA